MLATFYISITSLSGHTWVIRSRLGRPRSDAWLSQLGPLASDTAFALTRAGDSERAVVELERGRAQMLSDAVQLHRFDAESLLRAGRVDLYERFRRLAGDMQKRTSGGDPYADGDLVALLDEIRAMPGHEHFLRPPTMSDILAAADQDPIVYVLETPIGGLLLVVSPDGTVRSRDLPGFTTAAVIERITPFVLSSGGGGDRRGQFDVLDEVTKWLW